MNEIAPQCLQDREWSRNGGRIIKCVRAKDGWVFAVTPNGRYYKTEARYMVWRISPEDYTNMLDMTVKQFNAEVERRRNLSHRGIETYLCPGSSYYNRQKAQEGLNEYLRAHGGPA